MVSIVSGYIKWRLVYSLSDPNRLIPNFKLKPVSEHKIVVQEHLPINNLSGFVQKYSHLQI